MSDFNALRQATQAVSFAKHAATVVTIHKEMEVVWDSLKVDGKEILVADTVTRRKAQCVQLFARKLMAFVGIFKDFDMSPVTKEDIRVGNWRVDCLIVQIASNEIKSCKHLTELMLTNIYGLPTVMFKYIDNGFKGKELIQYLTDTYLRVELDLDEDEVCDEEALMKLLF